MRNKSKSMACIDSLCRMKGADPGMLYASGKIVLEGYRTIRTIPEYMSLTDIGTVNVETEARYLTYLENIPGTIGQERSLFLEGIQAEWLGKMIDSAMTDVGGYHGVGQTYRRILDDKYIHVDKPNDEARRRDECMSSGSYYNYLKEAVTLFGFYFWCLIIPATRSREQQNKTGDVTAAEGGSIWILRLERSTR